MHEVHLGAHGPDAAGRALPHLREDVLGGAVVVGGLHHLERHLGMDDDAHAGMLLAHEVDLLRREADVNRAVALPQDEPRTVDLLARETAERLLRIPHHHLVERHAHAEVGGVAAEMLVGQEQDLLLLLPAPRQDGRGVRRRAHGAAVLADQRFDGRRRVDVRHRHRPRRHAELLEFAPRDRKLVGGRHVGHGTAGGEVGQDHPLVRQRQHVGALGHEVHAAEHDVVGLRVLGDFTRQLERVAGVIGEADDLVALVVVPENHEAIAERGAGSGDARLHLVVRQPEVAFRQRLPLAQARLLDLVQDRQPGARGHARDSPAASGRAEMATL